MPRTLEKWRRRKECVRLSTGSGIEFAFEGRRFWNLRRWLTAVDELNEEQYGWNIVGQNAREFYNNFREPVRVWAKRKFISPRDYLFPLQSEEVMISGCVQNPGW
ncbi:MAG: RagB/SusD family nutrient uptake outer membrane protein [Odoribacter splanchnicus]